MTLTASPPIAIPPDGPPRDRQPAVELRGCVGERHEEVLTREALELLAALHVRFGGERHELLVRRQRRRAAIAGGAALGFLLETSHIRGDTTWQVAGAGPGLENRRVEIVTPADPQSARAAAASGANVWVADLEDGTSPTWANVVGGQLALMDAVAAAPCDAPTPVLRPRGWHLTEKHLRYVDRAGHRCPASAALVDVGLYVVNNARALLARGQGPYFSLPKLEDHHEARLWNEVFCFAEDWLGMARGTIRATVSIDTITAAFEMEEILYELRQHCAGLSSGGWDYVFSVIKCFRSRGPDFVLSDRSSVAPTTPPIRTCAQLLVATCHRRGGHAIGGTAAFVADPSDAEARDRGLQRVAAEARHEAEAGFDGTSVAHPDLVETVRAQFDAVLGDRPHQVVRSPLPVDPQEEHSVAADLLAFSGIGGEVTDAGLSTTVATAVRYLEAWLRGTAAVQIDSALEDVAVAEVARTQVWQWVHHGVVTQEGTRITRERVERVLTEVLAGMPRGEGDRFDEAAEVFRHTALEPEFPSYLTVSGYARHLVQAAGR